MIEYYECFNNKNAENEFTIGKIYKILNPGNLEASCNFIDNKGEFNCWMHENNKHFKPSTLEAFNLQEGNVNKSIIKEDLSFIITLLNKYKIK